MDDESGSDDSRSETLATRLRVLEAAMACIAREVEPAFEQPELSFITLQRIAAVARRALPFAD